MIRALAVFALVAVVDYFWAAYVQAAAERRAVRAAAFSSAIVLAGGLSTLVYVDAPWTIFPAAAGAFVGTLVSIRRKKP